MYYIRKRVLDEIEVKKASNQSKKRLSPKQEKRQKGFNGIRYNYNMLRNESLVAAFY